MRKIDYDKGFTGVGYQRNQRPHGVVIKHLIDKDTKSTIMEVFMYRDQPGVYYTAHGQEVNVALAKMAGFDVERHAKVRQHQLRSQAADATIAQELGIADGRIEHIVVKEEAGFKLVDIGLGRFWVEDESGPLNKGTHLTRQMAEAVFAASVGDVRKPAAKEELPPQRAGRKSGDGDVGAAVPR